MNAAGFIVFISFPFAKNRCRSEPETVRTA